MAGAPATPEIPGTGAEGDAGLAMLGAVPILGAVPSGVTTERGALGIVEKVDEPRWTLRGAGFFASCVGRAFAGGGGSLRARCGARRWPGSGCMIENGKSSLLA